MFGYNQMAQDVGLIPTVKKEVQKKASVELNPVVKLIDGHFSEGSLSGYLADFEKTARIDVPTGLKDFVKTAEEQGTDESEVIDQIFQKFGYRMPATTEEEHVEKDLLIKASAEITRLEKVAHKLIDQVDMMKVAMDLVEANEIAPYKSFEELVEQTSELFKHASAEVFKQALDLKKSNMPGIGKVASKPSTNSKLTPEDKLLERLQGISST